MSDIRYGDYGFCGNCHQIVPRGSAFCSSKCSDEFSQRVQKTYEKKEKRQRWLESLHSRVKRVLERKSLHRLERKRALLLLDKIEDQFTAISWEIYEKRRGKKNGIFNSPKFK